MLCKPTTGSVNWPKKNTGTPSVIVAATNAKAAGDNRFAVIANPAMIEIGQKLWLPSADNQTNQAAPSSLRLDQLRNATYSGIYEQPVTLTAGKYEGEPAAPGAVARPFLILEEELAVNGDLNSDGAADTAVLLGSNSGGSGLFTYLSVQLNQNGQPVDGGAVLVGDRTQIKSLTIESGQLKLDIVTQGPDDPQCCPTLKVTKTYALKDGKLVEVDSQELGSVSLADLDGTSWVLQQLDDQPVLSDAVITAVFTADKVGGVAGCNNYSASLSSEGGQDLKITRAVSSLMACSEPAMTQERQYLAALEKSFQWSYLNGQLVLNYQMDDGFIGRLLYQTSLTISLRSEE